MIREHMSAILFVVFIVLVFVLAQMLAKRDGRSIWSDKGNINNWGDLFLDKGDRDVLAAIVILSVVFGIGYLIFKGIKFLF